MKKNKNQQRLIKEMRLVSSTNKVTLKLAMFQVEHGHFHATLKQYAMKEMLQTFT